MPNKPYRSGLALKLSLLAGPLILLAIMAAGWLRPGRTNAGGSLLAVTGTPSFLPLVRRDPTPTPIPVPQVYETILLPGAECPNEIGVNNHSGFVYVGNGISHNISIVKDRTFIKNVGPAGIRPTSIVHAAGSNRSFVTHVTDTGSGVPQIAVLENDQIVAMLQDYFEPYGAVTNPVNGYLYVTDLDSILSIYDGLTLVKHLTLETAGGQKSGWPLSAAVDTATGLVYVPSWERGIVYVIKDDQVVTTFQGGWGTRSIAIDSIRGFIYMAHSDPNYTYPFNISVFERDNPTMTHFLTAPNAQSVAVDLLTGYAYFANQKGGSVTVLKGRDLIGTFPAGHEPWDVAVNPLTGYAYVISRGDLLQQGGRGEVTVLHGANIITRLDGGYRPWAIAANGQNGDMYVLNRGSYIYIDEVKRQFEYCQQAAITVIR